MANTRKPVAPFAIKQEGVNSINGKPVYIYLAVLDPTEYPPNLGDPISGKFETPTELANKPLSKSLKEALEATVYNQEFIEKTSTDILFKTIFNPGWVADQMLSGLESLMEGQAPQGTGGMSSKLSKILREEYKSLIIEPRLNTVYPITSDIESSKLHDDKTGSIVDQKLSLNLLPDKMAEAWIISDTSPDEVLKSGKLKKGDQHYVCFSEDNAKKVVQSIQKNQFDNNALMESVTVTPHEKLHDIPEKIYKMVLNDYLNTLHKWDKTFYSLVNHQYEYEKDMKKLASEYSANQSGNRLTNEKAHIADQNKSYGYDVGKKSERERQPGKFYIECTDEGLAYEVIGRNNKLKSGIISWHTFPWFPRNETDIIQHKNILLGALLIETNKKQDTPLVRYPHFEKMEHINWEIKYLIQYIQDNKRNELTEEVRKKIQDGMQNITNQLADYIRTHPYEATTSIAHEALLSMIGIMHLANDEMTDALNKKPEEINEQEYENNERPITLKENDIVWTIEKKIQQLKEKNIGEDTLHSDKIAALQAAKDYANEKIDLTKLRSILNNHPNFDKGIASDTKAIIDNVIKHRAIPIFQKNRITEMKKTKAFQQYNAEEQATAVHLLTEKINKIDYLKLDVNSMKENDINKAIYDQCDDLRNMEKYTKNLSNEIHAVDHLINELHLYVSYTKTQLFGINKDEKIEKAGAYMRFLLHPTQQNLDALNQYEKIKDSTLEKIIAKINKTDIRIIPSIPQPSESNKNNSDEHSPIHK